MENQTANTFSWAANNNAAAVQAEALYLQAMSDSGLTVANSDETMTAIAQAVGAKSGRSVRQKLASAGVYKKDENSPTGPRSSRVTRKALVSQIEKTTGLKLDSLEGTNKEELQALVSWAEAAAHAIATANTAAE